MCRPCVRLALCLIAVFAVAPGLRAQETASALWPAAGVAVPFGDGFEGWRGETGGGVRVETPLYGGRARLAVRTLPYSETEVDRPPFTLVLPVVGWTRAFRLPGGVEVGAGATVGAALFRFGEDDEFTGNLQNETEAVVGALGRVDVPVGRLAGGRVALWAETELTRIALAEPVTLSTVTAGISVRLDTPAWAQAVLR